MGRESEDWAAVVDRLLDGDMRAGLKLGRLITGFLAGWRAYDFREEWQDLVQEVLIAVIAGAREGRIRQRAATIGYVRTVARRRYVDRLKEHLGRHEDDTLEWDEAIEAAPDAMPRAHPRDAALVDLRLALDKLPETRKRIVWGVYGEGKSYEQVAEETGTPLGTLKRHLRDTLVELRAQLAPGSEKA